MAKRGFIFIALFFCSGATALVYEVVWSKYLSLMFGSTVHAQTIVLAVFMGGLALGNSLFGCKADRLKTPIRVYGMLEIAIGLYAFFFTSIQNGADAVFVGAGSAILEHRWLLLALKCALSIGLLLGPTILMGGTLPLLAAWLNHNLPDAGRRSALFYSINSLGAVLGAGLAGFVLIPKLGMVSTLQLTALLNVIIGGTALLLGKSPGSQPEAPADAIWNPAAPIDNGKSLAWAFGLVAITGAISMGLEVLAARSLALLFGSSLQAFAIVLIAFILGIGLGSACISKRRAQANEHRLVTVFLLCAAAWLGILVFNIENWVRFYCWAISGVARTPVGYLLHHLLTGFVSIVLLGVPAALLGSVLPLLIRAHCPESAALGKHVGRLLKWNTLGAVAGVVITGFVVMPGAGLRNAFGVLALVLCLAAAFVAWKTQLRGHLAGSSIIAVGLCLLFLFGAEDWKHAITTGAYRSPQQVVDASVIELRKQHIKILFYEDAPDATVSVEEGDGIKAHKGRRLSVNGKTDASTKSDLATQMLCAHVPLLSKPDSKDVFILGLGSAITAGAATAHPVTSVTVAENCEPVIRAARYFDEWNRGVLTNPVVRVWNEDARTILKLNPKQYDVIITEPSNPWTAGNGSVFSKEFYQLAATRLKPGGLMAQWFHIYDMHDEIVSVVLRTFSQTFPFVEIWDTCGGDLILVGGLQPWATGPEVYRQGFSRDWVQKDLQRLGINSPEALLARQLASQRTAFAIAGEGALQSDHFPLLEYEAPRAFFLRATSQMLAQYDERTAQADSAPSTKRSVLQGLADHELKPIFAEFKSINSHLNAQVQARLQPAPPSANRTQTGMFWRSTNSSSSPTIPEDATPDIRELMSAGAILASDHQDKASAVDRIAALIARRTAKSDWSASHYAALAAKTSLALGDTASSRRLVAMGLQAEPSAELYYLQRILDREDALNPRKLSSVK
jgi:spermidine synthase